MWDVDVELVSEWLESLDAASLVQVVAALQILQEQGVHWWILWQLHGIET